jgi:Immunity protein 35
VITKDDAVRILDDFLNRGRFGPYAGDEERVIDDELTLERDYGWLFVYNRAAYVRTKDPQQSLVGNGPVLVRREDGAVIRFSSALDNEEALAAYEADPARFRIAEPGS